MKEESTIVFPDPGHETCEEESQIMMPNPGKPQPPSQFNKSSLRELLEGKEKTLVKAQPVYGVVVGELVHLYYNSALIAIPDYRSGYVDAKIICAHDLLQNRKTVAIMFEGGDIDKPIIMGAMESQKPDAEKKTVVVDQKERVVIEAEQEIELRCGEASILLTNDGRILLRGNYISSQANATQRILGGSVQIN